MNSVLAAGIGTVDGGRTLNKYHRHYPAHRVNISHHMATLAGIANVNIPQHYASTFILISTTS
jgi:hypothetical protein